MYVHVFGDGGTRYSVEILLWLPKYRKENGVLCILEAKQKKIE